MTELETLTERENRLMKIVDQVTGTIEEKNEKLYQEGVFQAYQDVHKSYANLAESQNDLEALKRAIFLQWYATSEPGFNTGINKIDDNAAKQAFEVLKLLIEENKLDIELQWMLPYYYEVADWYIIFSGLEDLKRFSSKDNFELWSEGKPSRSSLENRGQLSRYWLSIWKQH